ncbi:MAG: papain-like cysteine protease family protein [Bryobacteraceae bacterium]|jgi:hypothetical protein
MEYQWVAAVPKVTRIEQSKVTTCWLAACQMLYKWKGRAVGDVEKTLRGASDARVDFDLWCDAGLGHDDAVPLAKALGLRWGAGGKLDLDQIVKGLRSYGPLMALGTWNSHSHAIVVAAAENVTDQDKQDTADLHTLNPWFGSDDPQIRNLFWFNGGLGHWCGVNGQYIHW